MGEQTMKKCCLYVDQCSFVRKYLNSRELPLIGSMLFYCKEGRNCCIKQYKEKRKKYPSERMMPDGSRIPRYNNASQSVG